MVLVTSIDSVTEPSAKLQFQVYGVAREHLDAALHQTLKSGVSDPHLIRANAEFREPEIPILVRAFPGVRPRFPYSGRLRPLLHYDGAIGIDHGSAQATGRLRPRTRRYQHCAKGNTMSHGYSLSGYCGRAPAFTLVS